MSAPSTATTREEGDSVSAQDNLFAALAALQADLPRIGKGETAKVPGKDGKQGYTYKYADLADVSQAVLPRLAKHGLAFTSKPTLIDGQFVLVYKLTHISGETDEGVYPLPSNGTPQAIGGAITYARRYSLCAVTGVAPDGDDDDAGAAEQSYRQSAGDVFENAAPARPWTQQNPSRAHTAKPAAQATTDSDTGNSDGTQEAAPRALAPVPGPDPKPHATRPEPAQSAPAWLEVIEREIDGISSREDGTKVWGKVVAAFNDGTCTPADRKGLEGLIAAKVAAVMNEQAAAKGAA